MYISSQSDTYIQSASFEWHVFYAIHVLDERHFWRRSNNDPLLAVVTSTHQSHATIIIIHIMTQSLTKRLSLRSRKQVSSGDHSSIRRTLRGGTYLGRGPNTKLLVFIVRDIDGHTREVGNRSLWGRERALHSNRKKLLGVTSPPEIIDHSAPKNLHIFSLKSIRESGKFNALLYWI